MSNQSSIPPDYVGLTNRGFLEQESNEPTIDPEPVLKALLRAVQMCQQTQNQAQTCRRCGISKKTLRRWTRYQEQGEAGLRSRSRRPHKLRPRKVTPEQEALILELRRTRRLGPKGLQLELLRLHQLRFARDL